MSRIHSESWRWWRGKRRLTRGREHALDLPQCNSFYRMLAHKLADYYNLDHAVDGAMTAVRLYKTPFCRM